MSLSGATPRLSRCRDGWLLRRRSLRGDGLDGLRRGRDLGVVGTADVQQDVAELRGNLAQRTVRREGVMLPLVLDRGAASFLLEPHGRGSFRSGLGGAGRLAGRSDNHGQPARRNRTSSSIPPHGTHVRQTWAYAPQGTYLPSRRTACCLGTQWSETHLAAGLRGRTAAQCSPGRGT